MRVALAGGGTAGHIEPALSLADALRRLDPETEIVCLGTEKGLETRLVPLRGYELGLIPAVPLPRPEPSSPAPESRPDDGTPPGEGASADAGSPSEPSSEPSSDEDASRGGGSSPAAGSFPDGCVWGT